MSIYKGDTLIAGSGINFPVGYVYMSTNSTSPASLFGGTWQRIEDTFLLAAGNTYTAGSTGGEATHTLTVNEMPAHRHSQVNASGIGTPTGSQTNAPQDRWGDGAVYGWPTMQETGGSQAHNNMPPYLVVYVWKRTA